MSEDDKYPDVLDPVAVMGERVVCTSKEPGQENTVALCSAVKDGEPLNGAPFYSKRDDGKYERVELGTKGPPKVATKAYRDGWSRTFDKSLN